MGNIKVTLAYDGTNYHGFQEQRGTRFLTVQGVLEEKLARLAGREIKVIGSGRTDAGVHARCQVVNFDPGDWAIPPERAAYALNSLLPGDIVSTESEEAPDDFHARFSAVSKTYRYIIDNGGRHSPFLRLYSYHIPRPLDVEAMREGTRYLVGKHDFSAFWAQGTPVKTTVREMYEAGVSKEGNFVYIDLRAAGFLYHMARMISGTLIRVGLGRVPPENVALILEGRNGLCGGPTAPARGLYLEKIEY